MPLCLVLLFTACVATGGSARVDVLGLIAIRLVAVFALAAVALSATGHPVPGAYRRLWFPALIILWVIVQLIPLPPGVWRALPGHAGYAQMAESVVGPVWRPLSMTPDLTINAFLALLAPLAAMLCAELAPRRLLPSMLVAFVGIAAASGVLGLVQLAAGPATVLRYYPITTENAAVGIFANRNHHAVFLACAMPATAAWARMRATEARFNRSPQVFMGVVVGVACVVFSALSVATGSRFGIAAALIGVLGAVVVYRTPAARLLHRMLSVRERLIAVLIMVFVFGAGTIVATLPGSALQRLLVEGAGDEDRLQRLGQVVHMILTFMPFGSGFGSFDSIYRNFEPFELIRTTYFNAAHNDLAQVAVEGGLPALVLVTVFLGWWVWAAVLIWTRAPQSAATHAARAASVATLILLLGSLVDYPLRTPLLACLFSVACVWMRRAVWENCYLPKTVEGLGDARTGE